MSYRPNPTPMLLMLVGLTAVVWLAFCRGSTGDALTMAEVFEARDKLVEYHIASPRSDDLLLAAWRGARARAERGGVAIKDSAESDFNVLGGDESLSRALSRLTKSSKGKISGQALLEAALRGMTASLHDGHTSYITSAAWKDCCRDGIQFRFSPAFNYRALAVADGSFIWDVEPGSLAEKAGIEPGDILISFNGTEPSSPDRPVVRERNDFVLDRPAVGRAEVSLKLEPESMRPFEARMIGDIAPSLRWNITTTRIGSGRTLRIRSRISRTGSRKAGYSTYAITAAATPTRRQRLQAGWGFMGASKSSREGDERKSSRRRITRDCVRRMSR